MQHNQGKEMHEEEEDDWNTWNYQRGVQVIRREDEGCWCINWSNDNDLYFVSDGEAVARGLYVR